jgi:hypothetical protein
VSNIIANGNEEEMMMGMDEEEAVKMLMEALKKGEEITAIEGNVY